jgi:hypothetical protein
VTVVGYHGTSQDAAADILKSGFRPSRNDYDWLGDGIYFFEDSAERAWAWARELFGAEAAVVGAEIELKDCMDLKQPSWAKLLNELYNEFLADLKALGQDPPVQRPGSGAHRLDRAVINYAAGVLGEEGFAIRTVRGVFAEGAPAFPGSHVYDLSHVQIAVRDEALITKVWLETEPPPLAIGGRHG